MIRNYCLMQNLLKYRMNKKHKEDREDIEDIGHITSKIADNISSDACWGSSEDEEETIELVKKMLDHPDFAKGWIDAAIAKQISKCRYIYKIFDILTNKKNYIESHVGKFLRYASVSKVKCSPDTKHKWIENLKRHSYKFTPSQKKHLISMGFVDSLETILKNKKLSKSEFNLMLGTSGFVSECLSDIETSKKLFDKFNLDTHFESVKKDIIKNSDVDSLLKIAQLYQEINNNDVSETENIFSRLLFLADSEHYKKIIKYFKDRNILLNTNVLEKLCIAMIIADSSYCHGFVSEEYISVMKQEFDTNKINKLDEKTAQKILLAGNILNKDILIDFYLEFGGSHKLYEQLGFGGDDDSDDNVEDDDSDNEVVITEKIYLEDYELGLKYACLNGNIHKMRYYLDKKIIPRNEHICYLYDSGDCTKKEALEMFITYGLHINQENCNTIATIVYPEEFDYGVCGVEIPQSIKENTDKLIKSYENRSDGSITESTDFDICRCLRSYNLTYILMYLQYKGIDFHNSPEIIEDCIYNDVSTIMYMHDTYNYTPSICSIMKISDFKKRLVLLKLFHPGVPCF